MLRPDVAYVTELARRGYLSRPCSKCGSTGPHNLGDGAGPHLYRVRCGVCGDKICFPPKPGNFDRRRHQDDYRVAWRELLGGRLICALCGITEDEATGFHIDHMVDKVDAGGQLIDEFWNTQPLCNICHSVKKSAQALRRRGSP